MILAIVTIGAVQESGIIGHAQNAATGYNTAKNDEESAISGYESLIESNLPGGNGGGDTGGIGTATVGKIVDKNSTINGEAYSSTNPIIPAGFAPINITTTGQESSWDAEGGPQVNNGLVITDNVTMHSSGKATIGSEFVWIPVEEINDMIICQEHGATVELDEETLQCPTCLENTLLAGKLYTDVNTSIGGFDALATGQVYKDAIMKEPYIHKEQYGVTQAQLQNEFDNMAKSAAKYGGFYVSRYEMSLTEGKTAQSKYGAVSSDASQEDTKMWYGLYDKAKTYLSTKDSVQSAMISGSQYDTMMLWMENAVNTKIDSDEKRRTSGTDLKDVIKNVYDLYGNSFEWTTEAYWIYGDRVSRAGDYNEEFRVPSYRANGGDLVSSTSPYDVCGCRITLYIM